MSALIVIVIVFDRRPDSILHVGEEQLFKERVDCKIYASRSRCDQGGMVRRVGGAFDNICYSVSLRRIVGTVCVKASIII